MRSMGNQSETNREVLSPVLLQGQRKPLVELSLSLPNPSPAGLRTHWGHRSRYRSCCRERCGRPARPEPRSGSPVESEPWERQGVAGQS